MKNVKTNEEKEKENAKKLMALFDDQEMSDEDKITMLEKQLNNEDQAQMAEMLRRGKSRLLTTPRRLRLCLYLLS